MTLREGVNQNMLNEIKHFATSLWTRMMVAREEGQALVEYSLILALISVVAILALTTIGTDVKAALEKVVEALAGV
jgi:pilus assembly protein Flp/PilA